MYEWRFGTQETILDRNELTEYINENKVFYFVEIALWDSEREINMHGYNWTLRKLENCARWVSWFFEGFNIVYHNVLLKKLQWYGTYKSGPPRGDLFHPGRVPSKSVPRCFRSATCYI